MDSLTRIFPWSVWEVVTVSHSSEHPHKDGILRHYDLKMPLLGIFPLGVLPYPQKVGKSMTGI